MKENRSKNQRKTEKPRNSAEKVPSQHQKKTMTPNAYCGSPIKIHADNLRMKHQIGSATENADLFIVPR
jgi:hypothetical protein